MSTPERTKDFRDSISRPPLSLCPNESNRSGSLAGLRPRPAVGARSRPQRAGVLRRTCRAKPVLGHRWHLPVGIVDPGWAPVYISNLTEDVSGYIEAAGTALTYPWKHYLGGHLGRLGTRDDVTLHQQYMADISASVKTALDTLDPTPYFEKYGVTSGRASKATWTRSPTRLRHPSSRSTPASSRRPTCSPRAPPSG